ncbi:MAG TPA: LuxR C-terminal-related transcriptional regulator [Dehalococcoidia bacterium]|nr:LuxR C-terminal-related transcriptional regulator [Dehalococcoidia bacterium]
MTPRASTSLLADLEAVVDHLALERFNLLSLGDLAGPICIYYVARHGERVSHLVLNSAFVSGREIVPLERQGPMIEYTAEFGFPIFEFTDAPELSVEQQRELRDIGKAAATPQVQAAVIKAIFDSNVGAVLERVTTPTLVIHGLDDPWIPFSQGRELAARLPCARFLPFESNSASPLAHRRRLVREIHRFLRPPAPEADDLPAHHNLTEREVEVLSRIAAGMTSTQVAQDLVLSVRTVERHISNVYLKLDIHSRAEAAAYALQHGLLAASPT